MKKLLIDAFITLDEEIRKYAISVKSHEITFSNLISIELSANPHSISFYLHNAISKIESSDLFINLNKMIEEYSEKQQPYKFSKNTSQWTEDEIRILEEESLAYTSHEIFVPTILGYWMRTSGYYKQIIIMQSNNSWVELYEEFLDTFKNPRDSVDCFLTIDGIITNTITFDGVKILNPKEDNCKKLYIWDNIPDYFDSIGYEVFNSFDWSNCDFKKDDFCYLKKTICFNKSQLYSNTDKMLEIEKTFKNEKIALQLVSENRLTFPNIIAMPCNSSEYNTMLVCRCDRKYSRFNSKYYSDIWLPEDYIELINDITIKSEDSTKFKNIFSAILNILNKYSGITKFNKLKNSISLYMLANDKDDPTSSFILHMTCLESLLLGNEQELKEKFAIRFAKLLAKDTKKQQELYEIGLALYKRRSDIAHGNNSKVSENPYIDLKIKDFQLRNYTKRLLLLFLLIFENLQTENSGLSKSLKKVVQKNEQFKMPDFVDEAQKQLFNDDFWYTLYSNIEEYLKNIDSDMASEFF